YGEVRNRLISADGRVRELLDQADVPRVDIVAGFLDGERKLIGLGSVRRPAYLRGPDEHHAGRPPVVDDVRKHVDVHEAGVRLSAEQLTPLAVGVTQTNRGLTGVGADTEHVELELEVQRRQPLARRQCALDPESALLDADVPLSVGAELPLGSGDLGRT